MFQPLNIGSGSVSSLDLDSMTLWIRIPDPDSEQKNCKTKIYSKNLFEVKCKREAYFALCNEHGDGRGEGQ
jgi:hypothetical protein